ncbi:MAG: hypothetical protein CR997_11925 [Acidobacteria bacterium]|nr:MAG: hypothetical protein CR997_11925 [Acidobacteriota bacterium]
MKSINQNYQWIWDEGIERLACSCSSFQFTTLEKTHVSHEGKPNSKRFLSVPLSFLKVCRQIRGLTSRHLVRKAQLKYVVEWQKTPAQHKKAEWHLDIHFIHGFILSANYRGKKIPLDAIKRAHRHASQLKNCSPLDELKAPLLIKAEHLVLLPKGLLEKASCRTISTHTDQTEPALFLFYDTIKGLVFKQKGRVFVLPCQNTKDLQLLVTGKMTSSLKRKLI